MMIDLNNMFVTTALDDVDQSNNNKENCNYSDASDSMPSLGQYDSDSSVSSGYS